MLHVAKHKPGLFLYFFPVWYHSLSQIHLWAMDLSGCSKWVYFQKTPLSKISPFHSKVGPPKYSKIQIYNVHVITSKIAAKQYSKNSNLYK